MTRTNLFTAAMLLFSLALSLPWIMPAMADNTAKNVYVCGCGPAANCNRVSDQPGNAPCGKPLIEKQVLKEDADKIYVCACPEGCKCGLNQADPTKCACGKELRAYPKESKFGCAHGMKPGGGCDKPCGKQAAIGCDKPCPKQAATENNQPCCAKQQPAAVK